MADMKRKRVQEGGGGGGGGGGEKSATTCVVRVTREKEAGATTETAAEKAAETATHIEAVEELWGSVSAMYDLFGQIHAHHLRDDFDMEELERSKDALLDHLGTSTKEEKAGGERGEPLVTMKMESLVDLIKKISEREDDDEGGVGVDTQLYPAELLAGLRPVCTFYDSSEKARAQEEKTRAQAEKTRLKGEVILKAVHALLGDRKTGGPDGKSVSFVYPSHVVLGGAVEAELTKLGFVKDEWYEDDVKVKLSVRLGGYKFREVAEGELDEYERKSVVSQITEDGTFSDRDFDVFSCVLCDSDDWDRMLRDYDWDEEACNCTSHDPLEDFDSGGWTTATASLPCCRMCQWRERHSDYDL